MTREGRRVTWGQLGATTTALCAAAIGLLLNGSASAATIPLGAASGGVAIYYNSTGGEVPTNQAYVRAQFSATNTNGAEFNFDNTPIPGTNGALSWYGIFQAVPDQFGLDLVLQAPTSNLSVPTPVLTAYDNGDNSITGRINPMPVTWAISGYTGPSDGPSDPANAIINSLFRGGTGVGDGVSNLVISPVSHVGTVFTVTISGELDSDGLVHWYTIATPNSPVANFELTGKIFFSGTLAYDSSTDVNSLQDFYQGTVQLNAEVICGDRYVNAVTGQDFFPGPIPNNCRNSLTPCKTLQRTVDVSCPSETIHVAAGTYTDQVVINKPLTVLGAGKTVTIIAPTTVATNTTKISTGLPYAPIVLVKDAAGVTIKNVKIDGAPSAPVFGGCGVGFAGVYYRNASGLLDSIDVANLTYLPGLTGCQDAIGVLAQSDVGATTLTLSNGMIENYGKNGITCSLANTTCTISNNQVIGRGPVPLGDAAQNGIQISSGAGGSIVGNTVHANFYSPQTVCSTGVLVFGADPGVVVQNNVLDGNMCDLYIDSDAAIAQGNQIDPAGVYPVTLVGSGVTFALNRVIGSTNAASAAIYVDGVGGSFTCNRVSNNAGGGFFFDSTFTNAGAGSIGTPNTLANNFFDGNGVAVDGSSLNPSDPALTAIGNWWGCAAGPGNLGCDTATGNVNSTAPLPAPPPCVSCQSNGECDDGLACSGTETCNLGLHMCTPGTPVVCTGDQCNTSACTEPSGTCVVTPKVNGFACSDNDVCTTFDTCQDGMCVGSGGADSDGDGYCDQQEIIAGCNPNDGREIPPQANVYSGGHGGTGGEVLLTFNAPAKKKLTFATDPSCGAAGACSLVSHFCTSGAIGDPCTVNSDCNHTNTCRVVINYAATSDLTLDAATLGLRGQPKADVRPLFYKKMTTTVSPGCSRKVDLTFMPGFRAGVLRFKATGTTNNRKQKDRDTIVVKE